MWILPESTCLHFSVKINFDQKIFIWMESVITQSCLELQGLHFGVWQAKKFQQEVNFPTGWIPAPAALLLNFWDMHFLLFLAISWHYIAKPDYTLLLRTPRPTIWCIIGNVWCTESHFLTCSLTLFVNKKSSQIFNSWNFVIFQA